MGKNKTKKRTRRPNKGWLAGSSATQTICSSFLLVIAVGTLLLTLPISSRTGRLGVIDAMFTATSATCVTGLVVRDTWSQFSLFGQVIILMLIQVGGLGLVTLTSFFALAARRRMGFRDLRLLGESVSADGLSKATEVLKIVIKLAAAFEAVGIVLLLFAFVPQFGAEGVWVSVFTAISAFCNAGFDLFGRFGAYSSLVPYVNNYYVQAVIMFMIMAGGLGFMVWVELAEYRKKRRLSRPWASCCCSSPSCLSSAQRACGSACSRLFRPSAMQVLTSLGSLGPIPRWCPTSTTTMCRRSSCL